MKKFLKVLFVLLMLVVTIGVYYLTWTPSTKGISEKARIAVEDQSHVLTPTMISLTSFTSQRHGRRIIPEQRVNTPKPA